MNVKKLTGLLLTSLLILASGQASAVILIDTIDASDGQADTYFIENGMNTNSPFYRFYDQDWSWQHNAFMHNGALVDPTSITSAKLFITAYDVDEGVTPPTGLNGEIDKVAHGAGMTIIDNLQGGDELMVTTEFNLLGLGINSDIVNGLLLHILIDEENTQRFWQVSLLSSRLEIEFTVPNAIPVPAAVWLFGTALLGLLGYGRRRNKVA